MARCSMRTQMNRTHWKHRFFALAAWVGIACPACHAAKKEGSVVHLGYGLPASAPTATPNHSEPDSMIDPELSEPNSMLDPEHPAPNPAADSRAPASPPFRRAPPVPLPAAHHAILGTSSSTTTAVEARTGSSMQTGSRVRRRPLRPGAVRPAVARRPAVRAAM